MIIVMNKHASREEIRNVNEKLAKFGFGTHAIHGVEKIVIGAVGDPKISASLGIELLPGVEKVIPVMKPYKLVSREFKKEDSIIKIKNVALGGDNFTVIAGPCAIESKEQLFAAAEAAKESGATILRGGAFKPRTSPYAFQGLEKEGLEYLAEAGEKYGMPVITEVIDRESLDMAKDYVDILQIGARNMQNFQLLRLAGKSKKPILLKRGPSATIEEWLMAAEYIASEGNPHIILCERGIRTFETATRNTLDLGGVVLVKQLTHLPVITDPSHATGNWRLVIPLAKASYAIGAHGLMVEMHPCPAEALCDGPQSLTPENLSLLMSELNAMTQKEHLKA